MYDALFGQQTVQCLPMYLVKALEPAKKSIGFDVVGQYSRILLQQIYPELHDHCVLDDGTVVGIHLIGVRQQNTDGLQMLPRHLVWGRQCLEEFDQNVCLKHDQNEKNKTNINRLTDSDKIEDS